MELLNSFGLTMIRIEAERMEEARRAVEAGWTPEDHPDACCPGPEPEMKPANVPEPEYAATRRRSAEARVVRLQERLGRLEQLNRPGRRADAGEINIPFHRRAQTTDTAITRGIQETELRARLAHTESRVRYWADKESRARASELYLEQLKAAQSVRQPESISIEERVGTTWVQD